MPGSADIDSRTVAPYGDVRVLQLGGGIEVGYCAKVLADAGADVAFVETGDGHPLRRRGPLFSYLHTGKRSLNEDPETVERLFSSTDVIVSDSVPKPWDELHRQHPHLTVAVITPYGLSGPWAGRAASDLTLQAVSGGMAPRGAIGKAPLMVGGEPSYWFAGAVAAVSVLGVLPRRATTGGELIDVSIMESTHLEHGMHPVTFASMAQRPFQTSRGTPVPGIEPTKDGYVGFFVITGQQWLDFCSLIGQPQWTEDERLFIATERRLRADELLGPIREWTRSQTTAEIVEIASLMRIPVAPIGNGATLAEIDQFVAEQWFVKNPDGFLQPRRPYRFEGERIPTPTKTDAVGGGSVDHWTVRSKPPANTSVELPLAGVRVADFTGFWAGPMASGILAGLGADVIHIEGPKRPDGIRMNTIRPMTDDQWWEWSPLFCGANTNKRDLSVDLSLPEGRDIALRLLATSDVMLENFSPRVVEQLGLGPEVARAMNPQIVVVRMPAFGLGGPWRDRVGFAQTIEQAAGLAFVTGYPGEAPLIPNGMCDPLAGVFGAISALVALAERTRTGAGQVVESAMIGSALNTAAEQLIDYSASGRLHTSLGNCSDLIEQDVFRCVGDDEWVAISIPDDSAMGVVEEVTGVASMVELSAWCAQRTAAEITAALWPRGIPASPVFWAQEAADNPQFVARGFFESVAHPVCGTHPYVSWPGRFSAGPAKWNRQPSPTMGQHNVEILAQLGYDHDQINGLYDRRIISDGVLTQKHGW